MNFKISKLRMANTRNGLLFVSPFLIGFGIFYLYPFIASFYYSFTSYSLVGESQWIGVLNYKELFIEDDLFTTSLYNTLYYATLFVPLSLVVGLMIALLLNTNIKGKSGLRAIYFLPSIIPLAASGILWVWILNSRYGIINETLRALRLPAPRWFSDPNWSKPGYVIMSVWASGQTMIILLAGLTGVPRQLYEVAELDGANWLHKIVYITLPLLTPAILFILIISVIGSFQMFTQAYIMTDGAPANSTLFYNLYLYRVSFRYFKMGYGCAMAWILFVIVFTLAWSLFKSSARWVYYGREEG